MVLSSESPLSRPVSRRSFLMLSFAWLWGSLRKNFMLNICCARVHFLVEALYCHDWFLAAAAAISLAFGGAVSLGAVAPGSCESWSYGIHVVEPFSRRCPCFCKP